MLECDRMDISEGIDIKKTNASKGQMWSNSIRGIHNFEEE